MATPTSNSLKQTGIKRSKESEESQAKIAEKKARLAKFGLKFQSAGTLVTIGEQLGRESSIYRTPAVIQRLAGNDDKNTEITKLTERESSGIERDQTSDEQKKKGSGTDLSSDKKLSFGFQKSLSKLKPPQQHLSGAKSSSQGSAGLLPKGQYTSIWNKLGKSQEKSDLSQKDEGERKGPPPKLMSRQRELTLEGAFGEESDDEDDSLATLQQLAVRAQPKFRFNIKK